LQGKFPLPRIPIRWSVQYQMMLPLLAIVVWLVFRLVTNSSIDAWDSLDEIENAIPDVIAAEAPADPRVANREWMRQLVQRFPGWEFFKVDQDGSFSTTAELSDWNRRFLAHLPDIVFEPTRQRDFVLYDEHDEYWVAPIVVRHWPSSARLIGLQSRQFAIDQDTSLAARFERYGAIGVVALIGGGIWFASRLSRRVIRIERQIRGVAQGDLTGTIDDDGHDEVSSLARSVNTMVHELGEMRSRIQSVERNRLHSQIANGIAHELRNGLHVARLSLQMFQDRCVKARIVVPSESMIVTAVDQLTVTETLVRRLLALGKPQQRDRARRPLGTILDETLALMQPMFQHAEVRLTVDAPGALDWQASDAEAFQAAILNLCLNAIEAAGRGGQVGVTVRRESEQLELRVSDSGPGPSSSVANQLFEPFVTTKPEGIGLGLVLVRQAVEGEGGTVHWFREEPWTIFSVRVPLQAVHSEERHETSDAAGKE
jgi:signal transduction histidine kinase